MDSFALLAVPFFIIAGEFMGKGGISKRLVGFAKVLVGNLRGGLAYVNCITSTIFGGISGSAVADISSLGAAERSALLGSLRYPTAIYRPGHVMIWLGEENGTPTIVHAYLGGMPVAIQPLDLSGTLLKAVELK